MKTLVSVIVLSVSAIGCSSSVRYEATQPMSLTQQRSPMVIIQQRDYGGSLTASSWFERFDAGYRFRVGLTHPDAAWVSREGWEIWLEDANGRRANPVELAHSDVTTSKRRPVPVAYTSGGTGPASYAQAPGTDNAMDRRVGGATGRAVRYRLTPSGTVSTSHIDIDFRAPTLSLETAGRLTLVLKRGDDVLRFTCEIVSP